MQLSRSERDLVPVLDGLEPLPTCGPPVLGSLQHDAWIIGESRCVGANKEDYGPKAAVPQVQPLIDTGSERRFMQKG